MWLSMSEPLLLSLRVAERISDALGRDNVPIREDVRVTLLVTTYGSDQNSTCPTGKRIYPAYKIIGTATILIEVW